MNHSLDDSSYMSEVRYTDIESQVNKKFTFISSKLYLSVKTQFSMILQYRHTKSGVTTTNEGAEVECHTSPFALQANKQSLYSGHFTFSTHWIRGWVGFKTGLDTVENKKTP